MQKVSDHYYSDPKVLCKSAKLLLKNRVNNVCKKLKEYKKTNWTKTIRYFVGNGRPL